MVPQAVAFPCAFLAGQPGNGGHACDTLAPLTFHITSAVGRSKSREYKRRKMRRFVTRGVVGHRVDSPNNPKTDSGVRWH